MSLHEVQSNRFRKMDFFFNQLSERFSELQRNKFVFSFPPQTGIGQLIKQDVRIKQYLAITKPDADNCLMRSNVEPTQFSRKRKMFLEFPKRLQSDRKNE